MPTSWRMGNEICWIMDFCDESGNVHLKGFAGMPDRHWEGIAARGYYRTSSGRVVNNLIKTVRRQA